MNKEDYSKYYIQGSDHYLIPKDVFDELFDEMESWKEDTQRYKEVIDKAIEYLEQKPVVMVNGEPREIYVEDDNKLLDILKKVIK